jgi:hypothetical protein
MKRRAILIEAGKARGQEVLNGPPIDVSRLRRWMSNNVGGAWDDADFEELHNSDEKAVKAAVARAKGNEYAFVAFSGHGWISHNTLTGKYTQMVILGDGKSVSLDTLRPDVAKCTILCDACRVVEPYVTLSATFAESLRYKKAAERAFPRFMYRDTFDRAVKDAGDGAFFMFGCAVNECCYEDTFNGGYFTGAIIDEAGTWAESARVSSIYNVESALARATPVVSARAQRFNPPQNPTGGGENRNKGNRFPFGVFLA